MSQPVGREFVSASQTGLGELDIRAAVPPAFSEILTPAALPVCGQSCGSLRTEAASAARRQDSSPSADQQRRTARFSGGDRAIRSGSWSVAPIPRDLADRRVEITGPPERKMLINALNSGASVYMADFEDSNAPTWPNLIEGQINLRDAIRRQIEYSSPDGKRYALNDQTATLFVRPRGWHLEEKHVWLDGHPISGSLFDFGLFFFHNAAELLKRGSGPYFYLPKTGEPPGSPVVE